MGKELLTRGVSKIYTEAEFKKALASRKLRIYYGVDPSGPVIHLGHAIHLRKLKELQKLGHKVIFLIGDFTGMIGDPTDRGAARQQLTRKQVLDNAKTYKKQVSRFINFSGKDAAEIAFNSKWNDKLNFKDLIELSSHFTVQRLLERDMYIQRMYGLSSEKEKEIFEKSGISKITHHTYIQCKECKKAFPSPLQFGDEKAFDSADLFNNKTPCPYCGKVTVFNKEDMIQIRPRPIHLHEFIYPVVQAYDAVMLDADVQIGGTDQTYNMLAGRELMRRLKNKTNMVITLELLEGTDGRKMSKSLNNIIAIEDKPSDMYGKVMSLQDELIVKYFELATEVPQKKVEKIAKELKADKNPRDVKALLAYEIVKLYWGEKEAKKAEEEFNKVFRKKDKPSNIPSVKIKKNSAVVDVLVESKTLPSKSEARRLIAQGGLKVNNKQVLDLFYKVKKNDVIKAGKRKWLKII